ncbi:N5-glutamine methyltransferase family protein [Streptomyces sp. NY05-11A]|uniref:N5-glutamine methyltransferase family protein n=1 Tax=Streptomyces soliscabiei TaxID=588897 RepID=UPI0029B9ACE6|nr:HemK/PrmC family methyltransferase [Streptomyces sp. NY05-11A]MDX2680428.1 peptide chain release factor N(5)-glutamine methyltransferase [Streptomyces sp. NY05-11A]
MTTVPQTHTACERARTQLTEAGVWDVEGDLTALRERFLTEESPMALTRFETAVAERCRRIPLGHLIGAVPFDGLELVVGSGVFVPRHESTSVVEWAASDTTLPHGGTVLDLCSGVGALGLALSKRRPDASVTCVERDDTCLQYLARNAARNESVLGPVVVQAADLTEPGCLDAHLGTTDLVMANPPYVSPLWRLLPEWSEHQPRSAVYSSADGLLLIRRIAELSAAVLRPGGRLAIEHDRAQPAQVSALLRGDFFEEIATLCDIAGEPRITVARRTAHQGTG